MPPFESEFTKEETAAIKSEFQRIGKNIYLDHAGTTLYSEQQVDNATKVLKENLFCNPHTCKVTGDLIDQVRYRILSHFNTNATEYAVVFTSNATAALKLVAESFDFGSESEHGCFYYCQENHTSVLGMRELVRTDRMFVLTKDQIMDNLSEQYQTPPSSGSMKGNSLLAFSAQCNFSGFKLDLGVIEPIQRRGLVKRGLHIRGEPLAVEADNGDAASDFYICVDTASYVATNFLDLKKHKPDFCCISFYKMFGFPTGVGALLVSKRGQAVLKKHYYGGGTVKISMTREDFHEKRDDFAVRFEDGTLPFLSIASLLEGFRTVERLVPPTPSLLSIQRISRHVFQLAKYCHDYLTELRHANGAKLVEFYNHTGFESVKTQGGIIAFNILHDDSSYVGFAEVACIAAVHNIQLRTGCFCNSGACQRFLQLSNTEIRKHYAAGHVCSDYIDLVDGQPTGAVRMSFGYMTNFEDVKRALDLLKECYLSTTVKRLKLIELHEKHLPKALQQVPERLRPQIKKMCIYPVKSCGAYEVTGDAEWNLISSGFEFDRNWMIVDSNGMALTQKHHTRLCLIRPCLDLKANTLELTFPGMKKVTVPLVLDLDALSDQHKTIESRFCQSKVCSDLVEGYDCGQEVSDWLSDCLETSGLRLIRQNSERRHGKDGQVKDISLANQAQFLLINRRSAKWLADKIETEREDLDRTVDRFRANIIVETMEPFEENSFEELSIGDVIFKVDGFCTRCQMICIDQHTGQKTVEPLRTIAKEFSGKMRFGIYLSLKDGKPSAQSAVLSCKQTLKILRYKDNAYDFSM